MRVSCSSVSLPSSIGKSMARRISPSSVSISYWTTRLSQLIWLSVRWTAARRRAPALGGSR